MPTLQKLTAEVMPSQKSHMNVVQFPMITELQIFEIENDFNLT
jgi:hypothetical protein